MGKGRLEPDILWQALFFGIKYRFGNPQNVSRIRVCFAKLCWENKSGKVTVLCFDFFQMQHFDFLEGQNDSLEIAFHFFPFFLNVKMEKHCLKSKQNVLPLFDLLTNVKFWVIPKQPPLPPWFGTASELKNPLFAQLKLKPQPKVT